MGKNLVITPLLEKYIENFSQSLHPIQKEIISYNESLGEIKCATTLTYFFLELLIKETKISFGTVIMAGFQYTLNVSGSTR